MLKTNKLLRVVLFFLILFIAVPNVEAGRNKSDYGYSGTGSNSKSTRVKGYTKSNGTYVAPYRRTTGNRTQKDNYNTKGNYNPYNGKTGRKKAKY